MLRIVYCVFILLFVCLLFKLFFSCSHVVRSNKTLNIRNKGRRYHSKATEEVFNVHVNRMYIVYIYKFHSSETEFEKGENNRIK